MCCDLFQHGNTLTTLTNQTYSTTKANNQTNPLATFHPEAHFSNKKQHLWQIQGRFATHSFMLVFVKYTESAAVGIVFFSNTTNTIIEFTPQLTLLTGHFCWCITEVHDLFALLVRRVAVLHKQLFKYLKLVLSKHEAITPCNMWQHIYDVRMTRHNGRRCTMLIHVWSMHRRQLFHRHCTVICGIRCCWSCTKNVNDVANLF